MSDRHRTARDWLAPRFSLPSLSHNGLTTEEAAAGEVDKNNPEIERLLGDAKIDVAEYFASGHTREDFEEILRNAQAPVEFGINSLSIPVDGTLSEDSQWLTSRRLIRSSHEGIV